MDLPAQIERDIKQAMLAKDTARLETLRFLKSAIQYAVLEKREGWTDADARQVIQKQIKQRRESIEQFAKAGRGDLASPEEQALKVLESYLPQQMPDAELAAFVAAEAKAAGAASKKDFGRMMKLLNDKLGGRADARRISDALGKILP